MIKRIKEIENIGVFSSFTTGASMGLEKLNFIFGLNAYGKTTLTDIFQSLKYNDNSFIIKRKTIPKMSTKQKVTLSIKEQVSGSEQDLIFQNDNWGKNSIAQRLEIFGPDFIHKNLFTGSIIERGNRENFTQFILGEQGVKLAETIAQKRQDLGSKKRGLKSLIPKFVVDKSEAEIKKFLDFPIENLIKEDIEKQILENKKDLLKERERLAEPSKITNLKEPEGVLLLKDSLIDNIASVNALLSEDYQSIKEDSVSRLNKHLEANFTNTINAKNWIKSGMGYCKGHQNGGCPFCGQGLSGAKELIELYNSYFDDGYNTFINRISTGLSDELSKIENVNYNRKPALLSALSIINRYKELIKSETFLSRLKEFEDLITLIDEDNIVADKNNVLKDLKVKTEEKKQSPYKKIDSVNSDNLSRALTKYYDLLTSLNKLVEEMTAEIKAFKKPYYDMRSIQEVINKLSKELSYLEYKKARIEQDSECKMYIASQKDIELINSELKLLDNQLQIDQSGYVKKYFEEINTLLKIFGSKNFLLEQDVDNKGYLPVYSIKVKYHGEDIPNDKLDTIFCESDRRALALSVFWAKFNLMTEEEKKKAIIVLDDPVTSFDDNRITKTINVITAALPSITQMIILTHYPYFIKRVEQLLYSFNETQQHLILQKDEKTSYIEKLNLKDFVATDFQKIFCKIHDYVNRKCCDSIKTDLRPFLEKLYLPVIFAKPIKEHNININENLESLIESLYKCGAIKDKAKNKLHEIRKTLNPESHSFTLSNDEDVRTFAEDMLGFLFSLSYSD